MAPCSISMARQGSAVAVPVRFATPQRAARGGVAARYRALHRQGGQDQFAGMNSSIDRSCRRAVLQSPGHLREPRHGLHAFDCPTIAKRRSRSSRPSSPSAGEAGGIDRCPSLRLFGAEQDRIHSLEGPGRVIRSRDQNPKPLRRRRDAAPIGAFPNCFHRLHVRNPIAAGIHEL